MEDALHDLQPQLAANRRYWTGWSGDEPDNALPMYRTDITHPLLNGVLRVRDKPLDEAITEARRRLDGSVQAWWVGDDSDDGVADGLLARGAQPLTEMPVMSIDVTRLPVVAGAHAPDDLSIRAVCGVEELRRYVNCYLGPLGIAADQSDVVRDRERHFAFTEVVRLAGIVGGETVGTCTLSFGADVAALYCIATDEAHRRSGIATALTLEALRLARDSGRSVVTLQSSAEGEPVYRRIGFRTVSRYRLFTLPG